MDDINWPGQRGRCLEMAVRHERQTDFYLDALSVLRRADAYYQFLRAEPEKFHLRLKVLELADLGHGSPEEATKDAETYLEYLGAPDFMTIPAEG